MGEFRRQEKPLPHAMKTLPANLPGPEIPESAVLTDSTVRSYCVHEGATYRVKHFTLEVKPRKFRPRYFVDLSAPYSPVR